MERLILLRHGEAEHAAASGQDFDRRLSPRGVREFPAMARILADMGFAPDLALISTSARTRDTWQAVSPTFPAAPSRFDDELYLAETDTVRRILAAADGAARTALVVGHNPGLQDLTVRLLAEGGSPAPLVSRARAQFPTAAAAVFLFDHAGRPAFDGLFFPERREGRLTRIYKILPRPEWEAALALGRFDGSAVDRADGYIHFSTAAQAAETARRHFAGQAGLLVLEVEADDLGAAIRWEPSRGGDLFPHLYASLEVAQVRAVVEAPLDEDGTPRLPSLA